MTLSVLCSLSVLSLPSLSPLSLPPTKKKKKHESQNRNSCKPNHLTDLFLCNIVRRALTLATERLNSPAPISRSEKPVLRKRTNILSSAGVQYVYVMQSTQDSHVQPNRCQHPQACEQHHTEGISIDHSSFHHLDLCPGKPTASAASRIPPLGNRLNSVTIITPI